MELGRIDIFAVVAVMSQYSESPQLGHPEGLYYMFEYLMKYDMSRVVFDLFQPKVDDSVFVSGTTDCKYFYGETKEELPPEMPDPLGKNSHTTCFVYDNHDGRFFT